MNRGKRFDEEPKLNLKKVFATILAFFVVILVIVSIKNLFNKGKNTQEVAVETTYFTVFDNNKYGVIDNKGNVIIKPTYDEMIIIPDSKEDLFICTYNVDYTNNTYDIKVLNAKGKNILGSYKKIQAIENSDFNEIWYDNNLLTYEENGLKGLIKFDGTKVTEAKYTNIYSLSGTQKTIIIEKDGLKGIVNSEMGSIIAEEKYSEVLTLSKNTCDDGYIVKQNDKYGIIAANGKNILDCNYAKINQVTGNGLYVVDDGAGLKIINGILETVVPGGFDEVTEINGEYITIKRDNKYSVINKAQETKIPLEYDDIVYAHDNYYIAKKNSKYGIVSTENVVCVDFKYSSIAKTENTNFYQAENDDHTTDIINRDFETKLSNVIISELNVNKGYLRIRENNNYVYYNFNFDKKSNIDVLTTSTLFLVRNESGKYGYVNKNNELIVDYKYDDAKEQNAYGYCVVKKDGVWGVLASDGTEVLKPSVNMDDYVYIDFISTWHLYKDIDLNIYVK